MESKVVDENEEGPVVPMRVDRFGFVKQEHGNIEGLARSRSAFEYQRDERRIRKWRKMIGVGGSDWKQYVRRKPHVVKRRIRKGIPDCLRGLVWQLISGSRDLLLLNPGVYEQLVIYETSASELDIIRDISRTFPSHVFFQQRHGPGQRSLYNVLKAYSVFDRDVGYVQVGLPLVQQYLFQFDRLVKEHMPKLGEHFAQEMINPSMYASQWFITVFSYSFPFHLALRIWDVFLFEVKLPFEKLIHALRNFPEDAMNPDILLSMAFSIKVSKHLKELKQEYDQQREKPPASPVKQ
ncbi:hypothetical protein RND71_041239 [Anisodus tanguticus]|uniref:Rab-GAP TBC domain-containing protein n=1 Tax=Anisodus tanguticus TaxID=243964 RepID=A0AAE1QWY7_9SOLA|nr:hypothetical protein RND71_041239 [Anisodus tanguticus]